MEKHSIADQQVRDAVIAMLNQLQEATSEAEFNALWKVISPALQQIGGTDLESYELCLLFALFTHLLQDTLQQIMWRNDLIALIHFILRHGLHGEIQAPIEPIDSSASLLD